jgi:hypothetical protein
MKIMNRERLKREKEVGDLKTTVNYLKESKVNLNNELKKIIQHSNSLAEESRGL